MRISTNITPKRDIGWKMPYFQNHTRYGHTCHGRWI